jgi:hypothetical protein
MDVLGYYVIEAVLILLLRFYTKSRSIVTKLQIILLIDLLPFLSSYLTFTYLFIFTNRPFYPDLLMVVISTSLSIMLMVRDIKEDIEINFIHPPLVRIRKRDEE